MFSGVNYFSRLSDEYAKYGKYPYKDDYDYIVKELNMGNKSKTLIMPTFDDFSSEMQEFALEWITIFVNGDSLGDCKITGEHSMYLNAGWITRLQIENNKVISRSGGFPDFWDEDWRYYWACDIARHGCSEKRLNLLNSFCDTQIVNTLENLAGGLDNIWGKARGVGASWKGGNYACYNQYLIKDSNTFIIADNEQYLIKDGIFTKFVSLRNWIQENCWFLRKNFNKQSTSEFHYGTGIKINIGGSDIVSGFNTNVIGINCDGDAEKARGKRGFILLEEFGSFQNAEDVWNVTDASVSDAGYSHAQRRGFGTGGDDKLNFLALEKIMNDPVTYNLLQMKNDYDDFKKPIAFFTSGYTSVIHKDENGNSNRESAKRWHDGEILKRLSAQDPIKAVTKFKAEYPICPVDMFKNINNNILPVDLAREQLEFLEKSNFDRSVCSYGTLRAGINKVIFELSDKLLPYEQYPVSLGDNKEGCIAIYKKPFNVRGIIPKGLYIMSVDAYTQDVSSGDSIGSVRVYERDNKFTPYKGGIEVAWYDGRPEGFDGTGTFAKNVFLLAEYYNAEISIENDQVGDVVSYAKRNSDTNGKKLIKYLADQFDLDFAEHLSTKKSMRRAFGINMSEPRKNAGFKYYQEHLLTPVGIREDGKQLLKIHYIMSRGTLREIIKFNGKNADRLSSHIVAMYHLKESDDKMMKKIRSNSSIAMNIRTY